MQFLLRNQAKVQNRLVTMVSHLFEMSFTLTFRNHSAFPVHESGKSTNFYTAKCCFETD